MNVRTFYHTTACTLVAALPLLSSCSDDKDSGDTSDQSHAQQSSITFRTVEESITNFSDVCYSVSATNAAGVLWQANNVCASAFGYGDNGSISYIGNCDSTPPNAETTVNVVIESVFVDGQPLDQDDYVNPCPPGNTGCSVVTECQPNADVQVSLPITILAKGDEGFIDAEIDLDAVTCSAKLDCLDSFLEDEDGQRKPSVVVALSCETEACIDTHLYFNDIVLTCEGDNPPATTTVLALSPVGPPGNITPLVSNEVFRATRFSGSNGTSTSHFVTTALGLNLPQAQGCRLEASASMSESPFPASGTGYTTPSATVYPYIQWDLQITDDAGELSCGANPLDGGSGVTTQYTDIAGPPMYFEHEDHRPADPDCHGLELPCDPANEFCDGVPTNTVIGDGGISLNDAGVACNHLWVAVSSKGTIVKINVDTGLVEGEYKTHPTLGGNPSRTTVDADCSVWVGNREGAPGTVTHVGSLENGQCEDRNNNGVIDTSTTLGDIRAWTSAGAPRGIGDAEDECIVHHTEVSSPTVRHVTVDRNNDVWVSGTHNRIFDHLVGGKYDIPASGSIQRTEAAVGFGGYGGFIDDNDILWSTNSGGLLRWDTTGPLAGGTNGVMGLDMGPLDVGMNITYAATIENRGYGLCRSPFDDTVWMTTFGNGVVHHYEADGTFISSHTHDLGIAQGCAVGDDGHVWVAGSLSGSSVAHLDENGNVLGIIPTGTPSSGPTGVAIDRNDRVWATNHNDQTAVRIDPTLAGGVGAVDLTTVALGGSLYNYSDMTGGTVLAVPDSGSATLNLDAGGPGATWGLITWVETTPGDSTITVEARVSNDNLTFGPWVPVSNGAAPAVGPGQYLQVRVVLTRSSGGVSPTLHSLNASYVL